MKDLFVLTADADMKAVFEAILRRPEALGIQPISSVVDRHPWRDSGVFSEGPEFIRRTIPKNDYRHFILAFDHDGSGCDSTPNECARTVQERLDSFTFKDRSMAVAIAPELEEWLWHDPAAIPGSVGAGKAPGPKERLRQVFKRRPLPHDFDQIATRADLDAWTSNPSFRVMKETLQNWFPTA
jgi:hypothetical protein